MSVTAAWSAQPDTADAGAGPVDVTDTRQLRRALGSFATGVTVVTVGGASPRGMTANSFTSVSLSPPLVLVCVHRDAVMHGLLEAAETFAVSVLGTGQEPVARHFADRSRPAGAGQFDTVAWSAGPVSGAPLITGATAHLECETWRRHEAGDHTLFLGRITTAAHRPDAAPLCFHHGAFAHLAAGDTSAGRAAA